MGAPREAPLPADAPEDGLVNGPGGSASSRARSRLRGLLTAASAFVARDETPLDEVLSAGTGAAGARRAWGRVRAAVGARRVARRTVDTQNTVGAALRGSGTGEERLARCLQEGVRLLRLDGHASPAGGRDATVSFELDGLATDMREFDRECFRQLRSAFGVEEAEYQAVLESKSDGTLTNMRCISQDDAAGKSASWFLVSAGMRYMLKTVAPRDLQQLLSILPGYLARVRAEPGTLLPRFYGLYSISRGGLSASFFVMGNVFAARHPIVVRYDLKGSTRKRVASQKERDKGSAATFKDVDFLRRGGPLVLDAGPGELESLLGVVESDCDFLRRNSLMDYSMIVGLARRKGAHPPTAGADRHVVRAIPLAGGADPEAPDVAYIGMVDVLTRYTCRKRLETLIGRCRGAGRGDASCQPPSQYAARFCGFMRHVLACPDSPPAGGADDYEAAWTRRGGGDAWPPATGRPRARTDIELPAVSGHSAA